MRVLIYSETAEALKLRDKLRGEKHHASIRNPQYFNPAQFDKTAELAIADDETILAAYNGAGIKTDRLTANTPNDREMEETEESPEIESLESHTMAELRDMADEMGVGLKSNMNKAAIVEAIQAGAEDRGA